MFGIDGMLGTEGIDGTLMLGMLTPGKSGIWRDALFTMMNPTPAAMIMNTTAATAKTTHGIPPDDFRGGGAHGAP